MVCYLDEKTYGPYNNGKTMEQLDQEIAELEIKIYGHVLPEADSNKVVKDRIYDPKQHKMIEMPDWYLEELQARYRREDMEETTKKLQL